MKKSFTLTAFLLLLVMQFSIAQEMDLKFNLVTTSGGKSLGKINAIAQDKNGYMWFAGQKEKCLYRYDGNRIITYKYENNNPNSFGLVNIETLFVDDSGMVWIGGSGLDQFNPATGIFRHFSYIQNDSSSLGNNNITSILRDRRGRIWVGTKNGLAQLDEKTGKFIHYRKDQVNAKTLSSNFIWRLFEDRQGTIWIATGDPFFSNDPVDGGLNSFNEDGSFTRYLHDPTNPLTLINNKVAAMFEDNQGVFWVGTNGDGLHIMDRKTGRFQRLQYDPKNPKKLSCPPLSGNEHDKMTFITSDSVGTMWIGTMYSGINRYDPITKKITHFKNSNGFPDSTSWNAYTSRDGEVWITTENANLYRLDPFYHPFNIISTQSFPSCYLEGTAGNFWIGTSGNGILKYDRHKNLLHQFKIDASNTSNLNENDITYLIQHKGDSLSVGTPGGLRILNTVTQQFSIDKYGSSVIDSVKHKVSEFYQDKQGVMWFCTWGLGLVSFNPKNQVTKHYQYKENDSTTIASNELNHIIEGEKGKLWISGLRGINLLDPKTGFIKHYLPGTFITYLFEDSGGNLWAGSEKGLLLYDKIKDTFTGFFDPLSEISTFTVGGIVEDNSKKLWLTSSSAIIRIDPKTKETFLLGSKYGIIPNSLKPWTSTFKNAEGQLLFGHDRGFYFFHPDDLNIKPLNIIITDLFINSIPVTAESEVVIDHTVEHTKALRLKYNQNNIAFNFAAIDYRAPETIRYYTMLENYDNTLREVRGEKSSYYFNVQPGNYTYRIKAYNHDGVIGEKTVSILILPPWWKTWWAYCIYGLILISILFMVYRIQKQRIIQRERQKAQVIELAQAKEIEKAYHELRSTQSMLIQSEKMASLGELTAGIAHEIQNPLNFVNNFSELNQDLINDLKEEIANGNTDEVKIIAENLKENEAKIYYHGKRADSIVKGMLQHSRTSTGQKEPADINALADEYLRLAYHGLRGKDKSFNSILQTNFDPGIGKINIIIQDIGRVLLNLYNNAFYAVSEKKKLAGSEYEPSVTVSTRKLDGKIEVSVTDNGNGIPAQIREKIFQPFFTTKPTGQGTGLGLSLSYDIVKAHGGNCRVESRENEFTTFIIELPI